MKTRETRRNNQTEKQSARDLRRKIQRDKTECARH